MNAGQEGTDRRAYEATLGIKKAALCLLLIVSTAAAETTGDDIKIVHARPSGLAAFVTGANGGAIAVQPAAGKTRIEPIDFLLLCPTVKTAHGSGATQYRRG